MAGEAISRIKINEFPETAAILEWFVTSGNDGVANKISEDNLRAALGISDLLQMGGAIVPTSTPEATGDYFWVATEEGTYTNFGGVVLPSNSIAIISRVDGVFTSSITEIQPQDLSGLATKQELSEVEPVKPMFVYSNNLIDNSKLIFGRWNEDGSITVTVNELRTPLIPLSLEATDLAFSGGLNVSASAARFVFFDENGTFISFSDSSTVAIPSNATHVGVTIAYSTTMGGDPTNTQFKETAMLNYGETALPWESYSVKIGAEYITGLTANDIDGLDQYVSDEVDANVDTKLQPINESLDFLLSGYDKYTEFDGVDGEVVLDNVYELNNDGDFIEWVSKPNPTATASLLYGLFGERFVSTRNLIGYWMTASLDVTEISIRENLAGSPYIRFDGLGDLKSDFHKFKLVVNGSNWDLYVDDVLKGTKPKTNSILINNIGYAYSSFQKFYLKSLNIHTSTQDLVTDAAELLSGATDGVKPVYEGTTPETEDLSPFYVTYETTGVDASSNPLFGKFIVYCRRLGYANSYTGIEVWHEIDMSEEEWKDYWRIGFAEEYTLDGGQMIRTHQKVLATGESESVFKRQNTPNQKADFSGGWHGDEVMRSNAFKLLMDGDVVDLGTSFNLIPADSVEYSVMSDITEVADLINGEAVPIAGHPIDCAHFKRTTFKEGGYDTYNKLTWSRSVPVMLWDFGICCYGKVQATQGFNDSVESAVFNSQDNTYHLSKYDGERVDYQNPSTGFGGYVKSVMIKPEGKGGNSLMRVQDRFYDSKYYNMYQENVTTETGEVWESFMEVRFK